MFLSYSENQIPWLPRPRAPPGQRAEERGRRIEKGKFSGGRETDGNFFLGVEVTTTPFRGQRSDHGSWQYRDANEQL